VNTSLPHGGGAGGGRQGMGRLAGGDLVVHVAPLKWSPRLRSSQHPVGDLEHAAR
jgi:hypothetical protein